MVGCWEENGDDDDGDYDYALAASLEGDDKEMSTTVLPSLNYYLDAELIQLVLTTEAISNEPNH